ncbi:MAG: histidine--tRNA ligase [Pseudomonadota bacterium]
MSGTTYKSVRGMRDLLPDVTARWLALERAAVDALGAYGYGEIRLPLLEETALFSRGVGEATDIVEKEMYTFASRDKDATSLTLRPEATASCARALLQHGLLHNQAQKVWYRGPMFRYERPQKGRYRQFEQIGAEVFGIAGPMVEAELIGLCADVFAEIGVLESLTLELNTLGSGAARVAYREALTGYLGEHFDALDGDSQRRMTTNPLRILDSKVPTTQEVLTGAPRLPDFVDEEAKAHFAQLCSMLDSLGVAYTLNPGLVRGLDYYTHTVFEWTTSALGAQGTVCGGGRYDGLVALLGGRATPGAGFAMGVDRLVLLQEACQAGDPGPACDAVVVCADAAASGYALRVARAARDAGLRVRNDQAGGKLKTQMKRADASGATYALIVGGDEAASETVGIKPLRGGEQREVALTALAETLTAF